MCQETSNDALASLIKSNPMVENMLQNIFDDNKRTTSMFIHELRNPLSLMKGTIQYIETKHPEAKDFKYWNQLQDLVNDMEAMMSDASQLNMCTTIKKESIDLLSLINGVKNTYMPQAANQQIDLALIIESGCEPHFSSYSCDSGKLKQVLSNLIKNAFEATTPGNYIHILLGYLPATGENLAKLSIQVCNNGSSIPESDIDNIFVPFVTYKKGGTGVGLAVVKKIIELHFGSISVQSEHDLTCFTILLPL